MSLPRIAAIATLAAAIASSLAHAQQSIGSITADTATVTGDLSVTNGRASLLGNSGVVAKDRTAEIALARGGSVRVCATSSLHLTRSPGPAAGPLMLSLDRGAIELHTAALASDVLLTPDLRFTLQSDGALDLRIRVTRNGDTCVENRGDTAPVLAITDAFTDAIYELRRNQHVLFEHGSLREVVDHETSPCGCPPDPTPPAGMSIAEALLAPGSPAPAKSAADQHPFPAAVSQGLAPPPPVPQAAPEQAHAQVSATFGYNADGDGTIAGAPANPAPMTSTVIVPPPVDQPKPGFGHRVGRFFKRLFGG